ncbi:MAG: DUF2892 domain-containing protein [Candidatus Altiarchaeota archaeon]|nr:DUF2892 domain-containing protein [Candidatus Altiarchaeota archaeon]
MDLKKLVCEENVGGCDLLLRAVIGTTAIVLLALDWFNGLVKFVLAVVAFFGLFTALTRHCTPYAIFGFSTAQKK